MLISIENLERVYRKGTVDIFALRKVNLAIAEGEFTAIMGPSGSGKSTLLHIIGCLDRPSTGVYHLDEIDVSHLNDNELSSIRNQKIGFVFQSFNLLPQHTVLQNIEAPLIYADQGSQSLGNSESLHDSKARAHTMAERVGLGERLHHVPSELSGGEMQRVAIARALINEPRLILADEPTGNLDSHTGQEIMHLLQTLHQQGHTIIVVTHESEIAEYAERIIFLKDGAVENTVNKRQKIVSSEQSAVSSQLEDMDREQKPRHGKSLPSSAYRFLPTISAFLPAVLKTAVYGVLIHKLRSLLSVLGIVFGIGAIIAMLAIGAGAKQEILEQIALLGTNNITVKAITSFDEVKTGRADLSPGLTYNDAERIAQVSPFIAHLAPMRELGFPVQYQQQIVQARVVGTTPEYLYTGKLTISDGRFLAQADEDNMQRVCILGAAIRQELFVLRNPIGELVKIRNDWFRVIGTLENKVLNQKQLSAIQTEDVNKTVYIPLSTSSVFVPSQESEQIQAISIQVEQTDHVDDVAQIIRTVLTRVHHGAEDYEIVVPRELLKQSQQAQDVFNMVMGSIAGISLLVGGIGIMNIMLATVTERTREIGIRRAIGASQRMILLQFLIETLLLTLVGGSLGVLLGIGGAYLISFFAQWRTVISIQTILLAFGISALIGVVFGMYPASQGARMNPIDALRYE